MNIMKFMRTVKYYKQTTTQKYLKNINLFFLLISITYLFKYINEYEGVFVLV